MNTKIKKYFLSNTCNFSIKNIEDDWITKKLNIKDTHFIVSFESNPNETLPKKSSQLNKSLNKKIDALSNKNISKASLPNVKNELLKLLESKATSNKTETIHLNFIIGHSKNTSSEILLKRQILIFLLEETQSFHNQIYFQKNIDLIENDIFSNNNQTLCHLGLQIKKPQNNPNSIQSMAISIMEKYVNYMNNLTKSAKTLDKQSKKNTSTNKKAKTKPRKIKQSNKKPIKNK